MINLFKVRMSNNASDEVSKVLQSGFIGQGSKVDQFEDLLQKELKSEVKPVTTNSCTSAIELALDLIGVQAGDYVISTPATCFATNTSIINRGAKIIWADIDQNSLIDPKSIATIFSDKVKAIIAVNWAGKICDYAALKSFGVPVIEDAAHTWDVWDEFTQVSRGDYRCYSFQAIKYLTSADGGILIPPTDKEHDARLMRWFGLDRTKGASFRCTQNISIAGKKLHMNDVNASIGICNIPEAKKSVITQRKNSKYLIDNVRNDKIQLPEWDENCSYWIFSMHVKNGLKDRFIKYLSDNGIEASPVHYRNDLYDCTKSFKREDLVGVERFAEEQICIPNGWWLSSEDLNHIIITLNSFV